MYRENKQIPLFPGGVQRAERSHRIQRRQANSVQARPTEAETARPGQGRRVAPGGRGQHHGPGRLL